MHSMQPPAPASAASRFLQRWTCAAETNRGCCCAPGRERIECLPRETPENPISRIPPYIIELMSAAEEAQSRLAGIPNLTVSTGTLLSGHTRFGIGGPADLFAETTDAEAFITALTAARASGVPTV